VADRIWPALTRAAGLHTRAYRATGGRVGQSIPGVPGKMCLLDHVGAKSGIKRTAPLLYVRDGENVILVASKGGFPKHPAWLHNLKANPETTVQVGGELIPVRARVASPEERERLWPMAERAWQGYRTYQERSQGREIPMVVLEPRTA
jgi:deazaflavin-dependent oxidoreductase (nitroreductase family)